LPWIVLLLLWMAMRTFGWCESDPAAVAGGGIHRRMEAGCQRRAVAKRFRLDQSRHRRVLIGTSLALPSDFLLGRLPIARLIFEPMLNFFRALPPIALIRW